MDEGSFREHIIRRNSSGKEIPASVRVKEAATLEEIEKDRANERRSEAMQGNKNSAKCQEANEKIGNNSDKNSGAKFSTTVSDMKKSRQKAAEHAGMSEETYRKAKKAQQKAEASNDRAKVQAVNEAIDSGNVSKAARLAGEPAQKQRYQI